MKAVPKGSGSKKSNPPRKGMMMKPSAMPMKHDGKNPVC